MTDTLAARVAAVRDHLDTAWATPPEPGPEKALRAAVNDLVDLVAELAAKVEAAGY
jgi:hypothetical protein